MSQDERLLTAAIETGDASVLQAVGGRYPPAFLQALVGLLHSDAGAAPWRALAAGLTQMGASAPALACLTRAAAATAHAADRADILAERGELREASGDQVGADLDFRRAARLAGDPPTVAALGESRSGDLRTVSMQVSADRHLALRDGAADHPLRDDPIRDPWRHKPLRMAKSDPVTGGAEDYAFLVVQGDRPVLHVECAIEGDGPLSCLQAAVVLTPLGHADDDAYALAVAHLQRSARHGGAPFVLIERPVGGLPAPVEEWVRTCGGVRRRLDWAWIDLNRDEAAILADFRQTHRQQARWGDARIEATTSRGADQAAYELYAELCRDGGRQPPPWSELAPRLAEGQAEITIGRLDGAAVCGQIVTRHGNVAYYSAGAARRSGNRPLAHALLLHGLRRAQAAGAARFHLGALHTDPAFPDKLRSIALFKRGFTKSFDPVEWIAVQVSG